jgi:hypothetical protein
MSDFVDYGKRDASLPAGCKDLIDVLKGRGTPEAARSGVTIFFSQFSQVSSPGYEPQRADRAVGTISDIAGYVKMLHRSRALNCDLWIVSLDPRIPITVTVWKMFHHLISACIEVRRDVPRMQAVLDFLLSHGLEIPKDLPSQVTFGPEVTLSSPCHISPLPRFPKRIAKLICDILRHVGVTDETKIGFIYQEVAGGTQVLAE